MKLSIMEPNHINDNKGGQPVYISHIAEATDMYDLGLLACHNHIAFGVFSPLYRHGDNWQCSYILGIDFDDGKQTSEQVSNLLSKSQVNHVIVASKNHLKDKDDGKGIIERFHVLIPFSQPVKNKDLYASIATNLVRMSNWNVDMSVTKNRCAYYFKSREVLHIYEDGKPLDIAMFEDMFKKQTALKKQAEERSKRYAAKLVQLHGETKFSPLEQFKRTKYYRMMVQGDLQRDGNRYSLSSSIIRVMLLCGLDISEALSVFDLWSSYGNNFTRESVERRFSQWR